MWRRQHENGRGMLQTQATRQSRSALLPAQSHPGSTVVSNSQKHLLPGWLGLMQQSMGLEKECVWRTEVFLRYEGGGCSSKSSASEGELGQKEVRAA